MLAAKARALHSAGITDAAALAAAPESQVRRALAKGLPRALAGGAQTRKGGNSSAAARAMCGSATPSLTARSARTLQTGVHKCSMGATLPVH